jgi:hypothetical protein
MTEYGSMRESGKRETFARPPLATDESEERVARFRAVLAGKGLTVYSLAKKTQELYGDASPYFIPHNFYHYIVAPQISPHICQVVALSRLTGYSLATCLERFGFSPDLITRWQLRLRPERTILLPSETYDKDAMVPFFGTRIEATDLERTVPFSKIADYFTMQPSREVEELNRQRFIYARIGREDTLAFPDIVPGSIVRIDQRRKSLKEVSSSSVLSPVYLVEHSGGLSCCHVQRIERERILLAPHRFDFERLEFRLNRDAVILGRVDAEMRPMRGVENPNACRLRLGPKVSGLRKPIESVASVGELLRRSRERIGLSLRKVHEMSLQLALGLNNDNYQLATSALWDMETKQILPRHIEKIFAVCILYYLNLWEYLRAAGIAVENTGKEPLPSQYLSKRNLFTIASPETAISTRPTLAGRLTQMIEEIPLFFRHGFPLLIGGQEVAARELYWVGQRERMFHPMLEGAILLAVDGSDVGPESDWKEPWERPLYLIMQRDGKYLCGFCVFRHNSVTLVSHPDCPMGPVHFRNGQEAEVVGQVAAIARITR